MNSPSSYPRPHLPRVVQPVDYLATVWRHLTEAVCQEVFSLLRENERQRKWSLFALLKLWVGLLSSAARTQTEAVEECGKGNPLFPDVKATSESFFERIQSLRPTFFHALYLRFTEAIRQDCPTSFFSAHAALEKDFPGLFVLDGSKLHKVGRLLKVARTTTKAILPGSLEAVYDMRRGILHNLIFDPDGHKGEKHLLLSALPSLPKGSLLVYDRYACYAVYWKAMEEAGHFLLCRASRTLKLRKREEILTVHRGRVHLVESEVELGTGPAARRLRLIEWQSPKGSLRLLTNVMDVEKLRADQAVELYKARWSVERCFLSLKDTLNLNHLFNAAPAAVGQQVYATAILYNALRLSQGEIAQKAGIEPERISPEKLFPRLTEKIVLLTLAEVVAEMKMERYRRELRKQYANPPEPGEMHLERNSIFRLDLDGITLVPRKGPRRKRRYCLGRRYATSYAKIPGAKKYVRI